MAILREIHIIPVCITVNILPVFLFTKKKEMPPKTLPEKSDVIVKTLKYFETLTLIVRIKRQENQLILIMTI